MAPSLSGISDLEVIEIAINRRAFIITEDKDFGDELIYKKVTHACSLLLRLCNLPIKDRIHIILERLQSNSKAMQDAFSVLTAKKLRICKFNS
ncbi:MAG: DUF5615 family PIN-like protein [Rhabdochlamydiaceae bacterium]